MSLYDELIDYTKTINIPTNYKLYSIEVKSLVQLHDFTSIKAKYNVFIYRSYYLKEFIDIVDNYDIPLLFELCYVEVSDKYITGNGRQYILLETRFKYNKRIIKKSDRYKNFKNLSKTEKNKLKVYDLINCI